MKQIDFEKGKITENIFMAAVPMLVAQVLSLLYNIVDRIYIAVSRALERLRSVRSDYAFRSSSSSLHSATCSEAEVPRFFRLNVAAATGKRQARS